MFRSLLSKFLFRGCLAILLLASPHILSADLLTLNRQSAVQRALEGNLDLRAARLSIDVVAASTIDRGKLDNPSLEVGGASDFIGENAGEYRWAIGLSQAFPLTGRLRELKRAARAEIRLAEYEVRQKELALRFEVEQQLDKLDANDAVVALIDEEIQLNRKLASFLEARVDRAEASPFDVEKVNLSTAALIQEKRRRQRERDLELEHLHHLLGFPSDRHIAYAPTEREMPAELPRWHDDFLAKHPSYLMRTQLVEMAALGNALAMAERWADVKIQAVFEESYGSDDPVGFERQQMLGFGISIPLPLHQQNRAAISRTRAHERQREAELDALVYEIELESDSLRHRYADVHRQMDDFQNEVIAPAEANEHALEDAFASGQLALTEVFRAREQLLKYRSDLLALKQDRASLKTQWRYMTADQF